MKVIAIFKDIYVVPFGSVRYDRTSSYVGCKIVLNIMFDIILENVQLSLTKKIVSRMRRTLLDYYGGKY